MLLRTTSASSANTRVDDDGVFATKSYALPGRTEGASNWRSQPLLLRRRVLLVLQRFSAMNEVSFTREIYTYTKHDETILCAMRCQAVKARAPVTSIGNCVSSVPEMECVVRFARRVRDT